MYANIPVFKYVQKLTSDKRSKHKDILCQNWVLKGKLVNIGRHNKIGIVRFTLKIVSYGYRSLNSIANFKIVVTSVVINYCSACVSNLVCGLLYPLYISSHS